MGLGFGGDRLGGLAMLVIIFQILLSYGRAFSLMCYVDCLPCVQIHYRVSV